MSDKDPATAARRHIEEDVAIVQKRMLAGSVPTVRSARIWCILGMLVMAYSEFKFTNSYFGLLLGACLLFYAHVGVDQARRLERIRAWKGVIQ